MPKHHYDPKFDALTLYDSFKEEVLLLANKPMHLQVPQIDIRSRGGSTQIATPPAVWFQKDVRLYIDRASEIREKNKAKLTRSYLPAPYNPCILVSEADVVRSAALWLLHPVVIALQSQFDKESVGCYAEVTIDDCRCDALIKINGEVIVVMEYKNRGYIKKAEFFQGRRDGSVANRSNILDDINSLKDDDDRESAMTNNAECLTKQAVAYSSKFKTRFVALFDWDALFLWHFAGKDFRTGGLTSRSNGLYGNDGHAKWAYGTLVERRQDYRAALLGFIMEAYSNKWNAKFEQPARPPFEPSRAEKERARLQAEAERRKRMTDQQKKNDNVYGRRG